MDLLNSWASFCKRATPGSRFWLKDSLFNRLWDRIGQDARFHPDVTERGLIINYRGGYEDRGVTFYPRSIYPNPPRKRRARQ